MRSPFGISGYAQLPARSSLHPVLDCQPVIIRKSYEVHVNVVNHKRALESPLRTDHQNYERIHKIVAVADAHCTHVLVLERVVHPTNRCIRVREDEQTTFTALARKRRATLPEESCVFAARVLRQSEARTRGTENLLLLLRPSSTSSATSSFSTQV